MDFTKLEDTYLYELLEDHGFKFFCGSKPKEIITISYNIDSHYHTEPVLITSEMVCALNRLKKKMKGINVEFNISGNGKNVKRGTLNYIHSVESIKAGDIIHYIEFELKCSNIEVFN